MTADLGFYILFAIIFGGPVLLVVMGLWGITVVIKLLAVAIGLIKYVIPKKRRAPKESTGHEK